MGLAKKASQFVAVISTMTGIFSAFLMGIMAIIVSYEVIMRYVFNSPTGWTIEFVPFMILWGGFVGAALTLKQDRHIRVDLLIRYLSPKYQTIMSIVTTAMGVVFSSVLFVEGVKMVIQTKELGTRTSGTFELPIFIPQLCVPVGALLLLLQFLMLFCQAISSLASGKIDAEIKTEGGQPL
jgi:C4-dicarboxylate transporter DctQ subunit